MYNYLTTKINRHGHDDDMDTKEGFEAYAAEYLHPLHGEMMGAFYSYVEPPIGLAAYIKRLVHYTRISISPVNLAIALLYLERLERLRICEINRFSVFRLLCTAYLVAFKRMEDPPVMKNNEYCKIAGVSLQEMNRLELQFLKAIDFDLGVGMDEHLCACITRMLIPPKVLPTPPSSSSSSSSSVAALSASAAAAAGGHAALAALDVERWTPDDCIVVAPKGGDHGVGAAVTMAGDRWTPDSVVDLEDTLARAEAAAAAAAAAASASASAAHVKGGSRGGDGTEAGDDSGAHGEPMGVEGAEHGPGGGGGFYTYEFEGLFPRRGPASAMLVEDVVGGWEEEEDDEDEEDVFDRTAIDSDARFAGLVYKRQFGSRDGQRSREIEGLFRQEQEQMAAYMETQRRQAHQLMQQRAVSPQSTYGASPGAGTTAHRKPPGPAFGFGYIDVAGTAQSLVAAPTQMLHATVGKRSFGESQIMGGNDKHL